jgi:hypothetical protein
LFKYRTIEHAFQAMKFMTVGEKEIAFKFTVESGDPIGRGDGFVARANRKIVTINARWMTLWDLRSQMEMAKIAEAKYASDEYAREILRLTGTAQLWHVGLRGAPDVRFTHLESIRAKLLL